MVERENISNHSGKVSSRDFLLRKELAVEEANRCLGCPSKMCKKNCPLGIDIPEFILKIKEQKFFEAFNLIQEKSFFPAICSLVCPVEKQCEGACVRGRRSNPVRISVLENFLANYCQNKEFSFKNIDMLPRGKCKRVAIVGSGPAGLSCTVYLRKLNYELTIYEKRKNIGGMLYYGIPNYRLEKTFLKNEIKKIFDFGIKIKTNVNIGKDIKILDILKKEKFDAMFLATGAWSPNRLNVNGENLKNIFSFTEFLLMLENEKSSYFGCEKAENIAVIGGGNVAVDVVRAAKKLKNVKKVYLIYRRSIEELLANKDEIKKALEENIEFVMLTNVKRFVSCSGNKVNEIVCTKNKLLDVLDSSGRKTFSEIKNSYFKINADIVVICAGARPSKIFCEDPCNSLLYEKDGSLLVNEQGQSLKIPQIFAGGDVVLGPSTVAKACFDGQRGARNIHRYLKSL